MDIYVVLNMLGEPNRLRIVNILYDNMLTVNEIKDTLNLNQPNVSKHLIKLEECNMVLKLQYKNTVYCYLNPNYVNDCLVIDPIIKSFRIKDDSINDLANLNNLVNSNELEKRLNLI